LKVVPQILWFPVKHEVERVCDGPVNWEGFTWKRKLANCVVMSGAVDRSSTSDAHKILAPIFGLRFSVTDDETVLVAVEW
jgi:hypothetical protein